MTHDFSTAIMTVPERAPLLARLLAQLGPDVSPQVFIDHDHNGTWWNCKRALQAADPGLGWHLTLQEDAFTCSGFIPVLDLFAANMPAEVQIISLYGLDLEPHASRRHWYGANYPTSGLGHFMRSGTVRDCLAWAAANEQQGGMPIAHDDLMLRVFTIGRGVTVWLPVPLLIDHRDNGQSTLGHRFGFGQPQLPFMADADPLAIDWIEELKRPHRLPDAWWGAPPEAPAMSERS